MEIHAPRLCGQLADVGMIGDKKRQMKPTYYEALWHNCNMCRIHYMSEQPHIRAYLCDDCWNKTPHFIVAKKPTKKTLDAPMSDWPLSWILLYTTGCIVCCVIIAYYLIFKQEKMGIERQGTRATKHDGSSTLLRKILKELKEINEKL